MIIIHYICEASAIGYDMPDAGLKLCAIEVLNMW